MAILVAFLPLFTACPPDDPDPIEPVDDPPITSVSQLVDVVNAQELEGREVRLMNVRVVEVLGDTAFYVTDDRMAPAPPGDPMHDDPTFPEDNDVQQDPDMTQDDPAMDDPAMRQPMPDAQTGMQQDRALVVWRGDMLGDVGVGQEFRDVVRMGAQVDVFGTARVRDTAARPAPQTEPDPMTDPDQDPAVQPQQPTTPTPGVGQVYVDADRVEAHDPARAPDTRTEPAPGTGATDGY